MGCSTGGADYAVWRVGEKSDCDRTATQFVLRWLLFRPMLPR
jgi:hypothetical protein